MRAIELRLGWIDESGLLDVADDPDDRAHATTARIDAMADRVTCRPEGFRERLVDDDDSRRVRAVGIGELASGQQRDAESPEETRRDQVPGDHQLLSWRDGPAFDLRSKLRTASSDRRVGGSARDFDPRNRRNAHIELTNRVGAPPR